MVGWPGHDSTGIGSPHSSPVAGASRGVPGRGVPAVTNWYLGMQCRACRLPMQHRGVVVQGFVIHDRMVCRATLDASLRAMDAQTQARRVAEASELLQMGGLRHPTRPAGRAGETAAMRGQAAVAAVKTGGALKRAQADKALAPAQQAAIRRCLDGVCGRATLFAPTTVHSLHAHLACGGVRRLWLSPCIDWFGKVLLLPRGGDDTRPGADDGTLVGRGHGYHDHPAVPGTGRFGCWFGGV